MRDIGKNIRSLRLRKNMTQDELAEQLFVTRQTVSNYETGKSRPDVEMLEKIAQLLDTDILTLIYGPPTPSGQKKAYLITGICSAAVLLSLCIYAYLRERFNLFSRSHYDINPSLLLLSIYRPMILLMLGWTLMQILRCFTNLKPFSGKKADRGAVLLRILLGAFFLAEAPVILSAFTKITVPVWWNAIAGALYGNIAGINWLSPSYLPVLIGAGLWLCGIPRRLYSKKES